MRGKQFSARSSRHPAPPATRLASNSVPAEGPRRDETAVFVKFNADVEETVRCGFAISSLTEKQTLLDSHLDKRTALDANRHF